MIGTAVINSALDVYSAKKMGKVQSKFEQQLASDAIKMEYVRYLVDRFRTLCEMVVATTDVDPSSVAFQAMLKDGMAGFMKYEGNCRCTLQDPTTKEPIGTFLRDGSIQDNRGMPPETGLIWATGCKNALDFSRIAFLQEHKEEARFQTVKKQTIDLGNREVIARFALGGAILFTVLLVIKMQRRLLKAKTKVSKQRRSTPATK